MKNKPVLFFGILIILILGLLWWSRGASNVTAALWPGSEIPCLTFGHQGLSNHIHPTLAISVDGTPESIPANVGVSHNCMAEAHTHDSTGTLHLESYTRSREFTLSDFFAVWNQSIARAGFNHAVVVNGVNVTDSVETTTLNDGDRVELIYTSDTATTTVEETE